jgi:hypothetical protein
LFWKPPTIGEIFSQSRHLFTSAMTTYTTTPAKMHSGHDIRDASGSMVAIVHNPAADPAKGAKIAALMAAAPDLLDTLDTACYSV